MKLRAYFNSIAVFAVLALTACSSSVSDVATPEEMAANPELKPVMEVWSTMLAAAKNEDCEAFMETMRAEVFMTEEECPAAFTFLNGQEWNIEWDRSEWNATGIAVKIYEEDAGGLITFIHDTKKDLWGTDERFWE